MTRNWYNQNSHPALETKMGNNVNKEISPGKHSQKMADIHIPKSILSAKNNPKTDINNKQQIKHRAHLFII